MASWDIAQGVILTIAIVEFVLLLWELRIDIVESRKLTSRGMCLRVTCATAAIFVLNFFDPRAVYFLPSLFVHFLDYLTTVTLLQSCAIALYMYLIIVFQRTLTTIPKRLKIVWLGTNATFYALQVLTLILACSTNNIFWLGVNDLILIPVQAGAIGIAWDVNLAKVTATLREAQQLQKQPGLHRDVKGARRKVCFLRVAAFIVWPTVVLYSIGVFSSFSSGHFRRWGVPIDRFYTYDAETIGTDIFAPVAKVFIFGLIIYMLRKPRKPRSTAALINSPRGSRRSGLQTTASLRVTPSFHHGQTASLSLPSQEMQGVVVAVGGGDLSAESPPKRLESQQGGGETDAIDPFGENSVEDSQPPDKRTEEALGSSPSVAADVLASNSAEEEQRT